jgi:hypothetical protein
MSDTELQVKQLVNRLEDASSGDKLDALQELQNLAKNEARVVGHYSLQRIFDFLREQGSSEEYQESLDLVYRLLKNKDKDAALANNAIVLSDIKNIELLLDLLEHEDLTIGVMSSQILTEIHSMNGNILESLIQDCPAGKDI